MGDAKAHPQGGIAMASPASSSRHPIHPMLRDDAPRPESRRGESLRRQPLTPHDARSGGDAADRPLGHRPRPARQRGFARRRDGLRSRRGGRDRAGDRHQHGSAIPAAERLTRAAPAASATRRATESASAPSIQGKPP